MSDERREPTRHHILAAAGITVGAPAVEMAVLRVVRPEELAPALAQRELPVVIENDELQRRFEPLVRWQQWPAWSLIPIVLTLVMGLVMAFHYNLDAFWRYKWSLGTFQE